MNGKPRFPAALRGAAGMPPAQPSGVMLRPQRLLDEAARDARRDATPTGLGLDSAAVRARLVQRLRADGIRSEAVLQAIARVERHRFVDTALAPQAYEDTSLPIGLGQTISKPSVVARMLEWAFLGDRAQARGHLGRVLEIGTGCGYQAALLLLLASDVVSIERLAALHEVAQRHLAAYSGARLHLLHADGMGGYAPRAPYDTLIAAAGGDEVPVAWLEQLAPGGRLVAPSRLGSGQALVIIDRLADGSWHRTVGDTVQFVALKSGVG